jgi:O-antigen ligase
MPHTLPRPMSRPETPVSLAASVVVWVGALLIFSAPWIRGGNRGVALIALEWLALVVVLAVVWLWLQGHRAAWGTGATRWGLLALAGSPLWVALCQLTPMPPDIWAALPGRAFYREILLGLGFSTSGWRPASLMPDATLVSVLAGLPLVACFSLGLVCPKERLTWLFRICVAAALGQAVLGLAQLGPSKLLFFDSFFTGVIGTFANSNHFAGFLAMSAPLVVWELFRSLRGRSSGQAWLWGAVLFVLLVAVLATRSRAGLAVSVLVTVLALLLLPGTGRGAIPWKWRMLLLAGLLVAGLLAAGTQGLRDFGALSVSRGLNARQVMLFETWEASKVFWPLGAGLGTFAGVYPRFQSGISGREFVEHAHSDYVQLLLETGLLGVVLAGLVLALVVVRSRRLWQAMVGDGGLRWEEQAMLAAGLGLLALLLHAWVDFNMRIPALAMLGAFLFGVFMRQRRDRRNEQAFD